MPLRQVELQFFISPEAATAPGVPTPMLNGTAAAVRARATSAASTATVAP